MRFKTVFVLPLILAALLGMVALILALAIFVQYRVHRTGLAL